VRDGVVTTADIFTTSLRLAGVPIPKDRYIDGHDILPMIIKDTKSPHTAVYLWRGPELWAVRYQQYKAHFKTKSGTFSCYLPFPYLPLPSTSNTWPLTM
jgi:arylsulfatase A